MTTVQDLKDQIKIPLIVAPMFLVSGPEIVIASSKAGVIGTFPALNARTMEILDEWLTQIKTELDEAAEKGEGTVSPFGVNLIVHKSNTRAEKDLEMVVKHKVPLVITSVGHPGPSVDKIHEYGGLVFHDIISVRHAKSAIRAGVDGLILVCNGAGGHAGVINPFALVPQIREFYDGAIILAGTISNGRAVKAAEILGADFSYMGTRFIATEESMADPKYKQMIVDSEASDIVYTNKISGINANFMAPSLLNAGIDPGGNFPKPEIDMDKGKTDDESKAWKDVWSAGQGVGEIHDSPKVSDLVERLVKEYEEASH